MVLVIHNIFNLVNFICETALLTRTFLRSIAREILIFLCDALRDLVTFVQFQKREKHPWRCFAFSKVAVDFMIVFIQKIATQ